MPSKYQIISELASQTARDITSKACLLYTSGFFVLSEKIFLKDTHKNTPSNSLLSEGALQKLTEVPLHDL